MSCLLKRGDTIMSKLGRLLSVIVGGFVIAILYANCDKNDSAEQKSILQGEDVKQTSLVVPITLITGSGSSASAGRLELTQHVRRWLFGKMTDSQWDDSAFKLVKAPVGATVYSDDTSSSRALVQDAEFEDLFVKLNAGFTGVAEIELKRPVNSATTRTLRLIVSNDVESSSRGRYTLSGPRTVMKGQKALFVISQADGRAGSFAGSFGIRQGGVKGVYHDSCCTNTSGPTCSLVKTRMEGTTKVNVDFCLGLPGATGWKWDASQETTELARQRDSRFYSNDQSVPLPHYAVVHPFNADSGKGFDIVLKPSAANDPEIVWPNIRIHNSLINKYQVSVQRQMCSSNMNAGDCGKAGGVHSGTGSSERCNCDDAGDGAAREALVMTWPCPTSANKIQKK